MRLVQFLGENGDLRVAMVEADESRIRVLANTNRVYDLAVEAAHSGSSLEKLATSRLGTEWVDYDQVIDQKRLLPPLDHPDPAHFLVTGTGLTHLGSALARNAMHSRVASGAPLTDSMRLFQLGLEGGKPGEGQVSVQPEWFYKGNGYNVTPPEHPLVSPAFALDGSEEAELVGLYVIGETGEVFRVGFTLGNEFSDHVMEAQNYLYLAHSKLRPCSFGPELLTGEIPDLISGRVSLQRENNIVWEATFQTGEEGMSYTISHLEHHLFKYEMFRKPGDAACHFFGAATLSYNAGIRTQPGDQIEISAPGFGRSLRNPVGRATGEQEIIKVRALI